MIHSPELVLIQETAEAPLRQVQSCIVRRGHAPPKGYPWLSRIELPRMDVEDHGIAAALGEVPGGLLDAPREDAQIGAAGERQVDAGESKGCERDLDQVPRRGGHVERRTRCVGDAVTVVLDRED